MYPMYKIKLHDPSARLCPVRSVLSTMCPVRIAAVLACARANNTRQDRKGVPPSGERAKSKEPRGIAGRLCPSRSPRQSTVIGIDFSLFSASISLDCSLVLASDPRRSERRKFSWQEELATSTNVFYETGLEMCACQ